MSRDFTECMPVQVAAGAAVGAFHMCNIEAGGCHSGRRPRQPDGAGTMSARKSSGERKLNGRRSPKASSMTRRCNIQVRYVDPDQTLSPGELASRAATACLFEKGVDASEVDLLVYGGIARQNSSPRPPPRSPGAWERGHCTRST